MSVIVQCIQLPWKSRDLKYANGVPPEFAKASPLDEARISEPSVFVDMTLRNPGHANIKGCQSIILADMQ